MLDDHRLENLEITFYDFPSEMLSMLRMTSDSRIEDSWVPLSQTQSFLRGLDITTDLDRFRDSFITHIRDDLIDARLEGIPVEM
jgi:hypothetical protein